MRVNYIGKYNCVILICEHTLSIIEDRLKYVAVTPLPPKKNPLKSQWLSATKGLDFFVCFVFLIPATYSSQVTGELCSFLSLWGGAYKPIWFHVDGKQLCLPKTSSWKRPAQLTFTMLWPKHVTCLCPTSRGWRALSHQVPGRRKITNHKCS